MTGIRVLLVGGPTQLPPTERVRSVADLEETIKVPYLTGHEHFVHSGAVDALDGRDVPVFRWIYRTRPAE